MQARKSLLGLCSTVVHSILYHAGHQSLLGLCGTVVQRPVKALHPLPCRPAKIFWACAVRWFTPSSTMQAAKAAFGGSTADRRFSGQKSWKCASGARTWGRNHFLESSRRLVHRGPSVSRTPEPLRNPRSAQLENHPWLKSVVITVYGFSYPFIALQITSPIKIIPPLPPHNSIADLMRLLQT